MLVYWVLLAFPAAMAMFYPANVERREPSLAQQITLATWLLYYTAIALMRYQIGADWFAYEDFYQEAAFVPLHEALGITDPLFSLALWLSAQLGAGLYLVNATCAFLLAFGVVRIANHVREPWLAIATSVPYILIVVGFGYVRQAAAIGLVLLAINSIGNGRPTRALVQLALALGFHISAIVAVPFFVFSLANRNRLGLILLGSVGAVAFLMVALRQYERLETVYIEVSYQSSGALVRLLLNLACSLLLLLRWRQIPGPERSRSIWLSIALANVATMAAFLLIPSSTAVDRVSLFFSIIQIFVFGNITELTGAHHRLALLLRLLVIGVAVAVQVVWLFFATHAEYWVPYKTIMRFF